MPSPKEELNYWSLDFFAMHFCRLVDSLTCPQKEASFELFLHLRIDPINYYFVFLTVLSKSLDATADCLILPRNGNSPKILILPFTFRTIIHLELLFVFRSK